MIVEQIFSWLLSVLGYAIDLFPNAQSGDFSTLPTYSTDFLKWISVLNGYAPIKEFGIILTIYAGLAVLTSSWKIGITAYNMITRYL